MIYEDKHTKKMEKQHAFTSEFKLDHFGYGEWVEEPDVIKFTYRKMKCLIIRICKREPLRKEEKYFGGHLCGYVTIPAGHPCYQKRYEDIDIDCHGGLTFGECAKEHLIGFDCGHAEDLIPSMENFIASDPELEEIKKRFSLQNSPIFIKTYRNMSYCIKECKAIVNQLIGIANTQPQLKEDND